MACLPPQLRLQSSGMAIWCFALFILMPLSFAFAETKPVPQAKKISVPVAAGKTHCTAKEIQRQDCRLTVGSYNLRLLKDTIAWDDGTWKTVDDMPLKQEGVQWEKAGFQFLNGWPILQLWIWDPGVGEAQVQSLHWFVADAEKRHFTVLAQGVVRKRRIKPQPKPPEGQEAPKKSASKPQYILDAMEPHELKATRDGGLEWTLRHEKKLIQRVH